MLWATASWLVDPTPVGRIRVRFRQLGGRKHYTQNLFKHKWSSHAFISKQTPRTFAYMKHVPAFRLTGIKVFTAIGHCEVLTACQRQNELYEKTHWTTRNELVKKQHRNCPSYWARRSVSMKTVDVALMCCVCLHWHYNIHELTVRSTVRNTCSQSLGPMLIETSSCSPPSLRLSPPVPIPNYPPRQDGERKSLKSLCNC